jgi:small subunit ribosomal protein S15
MLALLGFTARCASRLAQRALTETSPLPRTLASSTKPSNQSHEKQQKPPASSEHFEPSPQPTSDVFYRPTVLTARQRQVYEPQTVSRVGLADHGYLHGITEEELAGRSEMLKRAMSTRTGSTQDVLKFRRAEIVAKYGTRPNDTGASRVQVAILTERINRLSTHLGKNRQDKHSKRSLALLTVQRRHLLEYMMRKDYANYRLMVVDLGLRPLPVFHHRRLPKIREQTHAQVRPPLFSINLFHFFTATVSCVESSCCCQMSVRLCFF